MRVLDRKLLRDLYRLGTQATAIALVMASGMAVIILGIGASRSLEETGDAFYDRYRFATVFASVTRAPRYLESGIRDIPGVAAVELRVSKAALLDINGMPEPATGQVVSIPDERKTTVNQLYIRSGRLPDANRAGEVAITEPFALAHGFKPGDTFHATMNGKRRQLFISGIVLSPEYVYAIGPGDMVPDQRRFGVLFMRESILSGIFDLDGAFNDVALTTQRGAESERIIEALDSILEPYGASGAYGRIDQISHSFLSSELNSLRAMASVMPPVFLLISAFLVNMILSRLIALEREQIGLFKAIGYSNLVIAWHYAKLVIAISIGGLVVGIGAGTWLGQALTRLYVEYFSFPFLIFDRSIDLYVVACGVTILAALLGAVKAIASTVALKPAVAMQPPIPLQYHKFLGNRFASSRWLSQLSVMALRHLSRWPLRTAMTIVGTSMSVAILVTAMFSFSSIDFMIDTLFFKASRQDATLLFRQATEASAVHDIAAWPSVLSAEPFRSTPVILRHEQRQKRLAITALRPDSDLDRILDQQLLPMDPPPQGLAVSEEVADILNVAMGDQVSVTLLEAGKRVVELPVTGIVKEYIGLPVYMRLNALNELMLGGPRISGVHVSIDTDALPQLYATVKSTPIVPAVALLHVSLVKFRETIEKNILVMSTVYVVLAMIITFGVIYNSARIQLSERGRELASLRVFGFTRAEVSSVLIIELGIIVLLAQPVGWILGYGFSWLVVKGFASDLYRIPLIIDASTLAKASLVVISAAFVSMLIVRRRVDRLDMVRVLKTRE